MNIDDDGDDVLIARLEREYGNVTSALYIANADLRNLEAEGLNDGPLVERMRQKTASLRTKRDQLREALNAFE